MPKKAVDQPAAEISVIHDGDGGSVILTETGLIVSGSISPKQWLTVGQVMITGRKAFTWGVFDYIIESEKRGSQSYIQLLSQLEIDQGTLDNYVSTARRVPIENRVPQLSFAHHTTVAKLPVEDQPKYLALAVRDGLDRDGLRDLIKATLPEGKVRTARKQEVVKSYDDRWAELMGQKSQGAAPTNGSGMALELTRFTPDELPLPRLSGRPMEVIEKIGRYLLEGLLHVSDYIEVDIRIRRKST